MKSCQPANIARIQLPMVCYLKVDSHIIIIDVMGV